MTKINYSSYAHVIEKGMNKRNMTGMAKILFDFMCAHENVVSGRITKKDLDSGIEHKMYTVPTKESIEWFKGQHDVAETLKKGASDAVIIAEAPAYFDEKVIDGLINSQKTEIVLNAMVELITSDNELDGDLLNHWLELKENGEFGAFLAEIFLYAVPQNNVVCDIDPDVFSPVLDEADEKEIQYFERLSKRLSKPTAILPPLIIDSEKEMEYIRQLLLAYADAEGIPCMDIEDLPLYPMYQMNFDEQRKNFYSAESIRESAKEILKLNEKDGFDIVKNEVLASVFPVWQLSFSEKQNGYQRLLRVLNSASNTVLSGNTKRRLLEWVSSAEKQGLCHFLVGEKQLWWV